MRYNQEKERLDAIRRLQVKRQELEVALKLAEQRGDLARVADIRYGRWVEAGHRFCGIRPVCNICWSP